MLQPGVVEKIKGHMMCLASFFSKILLFMR